MLSFNSYENNKPIAVVKHKDHDIQFVYLYSEKNSKTKNCVDYEELNLKEGFNFQIIPNLNRERDILYISGMSGSGKSFFTKQYILEYKKYYKKNFIYLISYLDYDESLKDVEKLIKRINIHDKDFTNEELELNDFENSLVILDDIEMISDKKLKNFILSFFKKILQLGRHWKISAIWANHEVNNSHETKNILTECNSITIFPKTMGTMKIQYLLNNYFGLSKEEINKIKNLKSRSVTIMRSYPRLIIANQDIFII